MDLHKKQPISDDKNIVKWNVLGLTSSTISLQYERLIAPKTSIVANINIMPKRSIPFFGTVEDIVKDKGAIDILKDVKMNALSFMPEVRFYLGKEDMRGFYIISFCVISLLWYNSTIKFIISVI